ncbi:MAG: hypothetical protein KDB94_02755 [Acidobacteria bacterium]|nr:hypothetical protein [Acidobacteriota bacterium]
MSDFKDIGELVVDDFAGGLSGETVTRRRFGPTTTVNFHRATPAPVETPDLRVFLPPVGSTTRQAREGSSRAGELVFYSTDDWRSDDEEAGARGDDLVRADGSVYHVEKVGDFSGAGGFVEVTAMLSRRSP